MTPQELKSSILQLAIQGKLVEQRPEEGTGEELYQQIQAEKKRLIQEGKIKKEKPRPEIAEDEVPFEIPESWKWVRLGDISSYSQRKGKVIASAISPEMWTLDLEDIEKETGRIIRKCTTSDRTISGDKVIFFKGQVLYSKLRPYLKKVLVAPDNGICSSEMVPFSAYGGVDSQYIVYVLTCPHVDYIINSVTYGVKMPRVGTETMTNLLIPLPPLAEQKRIVAKIEELLPYLDRYEKAWNRLEEFNRRFPADMQKSILQMAIQGKLVEQRPEEGTGEELYRQIQAEKQALIKAGKIKKEKPLPEIAEDEVPFEIPEGWKWVYFGELYSLSNGTASRGTEGGIERPVLRLADLSGNTINTENVRKISLTEREFLSHKVQKDDLLFVRVNGSKERVATAFHYTAEKTISYCDHLFCGHKCSSLVDVDYVMFAFNCWATRKQLIPEIKTTAGQNTINQTSMARILLPLPPLAEQKRIVARLEEILPLCERLK
mgnify:FL=1